MQKQTHKKVLPDSLGIAPLCVLMLDQGSIGTAGVAFVVYAMKCMVWAKWDKIHRVIRDLKNAEKYAGAIFMKTKLHSAYLFGINTRPFNSGANYTMKRRLLDLFSLTETVNSLVFRRYLAKLHALRRGECRC